MLREAERRTGILRQLAQQFTDYRDPDLIDHTVEESVSQRVMGFPLGSEDLNDHDRLRADHLLAVLIGKREPSGKDRPRERDQGKPLASANTFNCLELTPKDASTKFRYKKIVADPQGMDRLLVEIFLDA